MESKLLDFTVEQIAAPVKNAVVGGPFGSKLVSKDYVEKGIPVIRGQNMGKGRWVTGDFVFVTEEKANDLSANTARPGDLIFTQRGTLGQVAIVPKGPYDKYIISQSQMKLTPDGGKSGSHFLYYLFKSDEQQHYIQTNAIRVGVPHTNLSILKSTPVKLPPLEDQKNVAKILGAIDDKIEVNHQTNQTLEQISQAIFKSWFVDFEPVKAKEHIRKLGGRSEQIEKAAQAIISGAVNLGDILKGSNLPDIDSTIKSRLDEKFGSQTKEQQNELAATARLFPDRFVESELGLIPRGWNCSDLGTACSLIIDHRGKTPKKLGGDWVKDGYPAISAKNIKAGMLIQKDKIRFLNEELYKKWMKDEVQLGDVILTSEAPLGEALYLASNKKYVLSQRVYGLRANPKKITGSFLYLWIRSHVAQFDMEGRSTGSTVTGIRQSELKKVKILVPGFNILTNFSKFVDAVFCRIHNNEEESKTLSKKRDLLLPKLLSGELKVKE